MAALSVVVLEPGRKGGGAFVVGEEGLAIGPLGGQGPVEALYLPFCQGQCARMKICLIPVAEHSCRSEYR